MTSLGSTMPAYIFIRVKQFTSSWELLEAPKDPVTAKEVLSEYRKLAEGSDVEVAMVEAASAGEARKKLELGTGAGKIM